MDRAFAMTEDVVSYISDWRFPRTTDRRSDERTYSDERARLKRQQQQLEYERQEFLRAKAFEEKRMEKEKRIFDMEWKMLEEGWRRLAAEREQLERFHSGGEDEETSEFIFRNMSVSLFFSGVKNTRALKKRYKDLIKIFHPDNGAGDTEVLQRINEEYETLKESLGSVKSRIFQD